MKAAGYALWPIVQQDCRKMWFNLPSVTYSLNTVADLMVIGLSIKDVKTFLQKQNK